LRTIYTDGSGWSGIKSAWCVYIKSDISTGIDELFIKVFKTPYTNNEMEYLAFIKGAELAKPGDRIITDSELVVKQLKGEYKVKSDNLKKLYIKAKSIVSNKGILYEHKTRNYNNAGIFLEKTLKLL